MKTTKLPHPFNCEGGCGSVVTEYVDYESVQASVCTSCYINGIKEERDLAEKQSDIFDKQLRELRQAP